MRKHYCKCKYFPTLSLTWLTLAWPQCKPAFSHFVLWEAVSQRKYCCTPKIQHFGPPKIFGLATPMSHCIAASPVEDVWGQQLRAGKRINYRNLKWTFEDSLPCYCCAIKSNCRNALTSFASRVCRQRSGDEWTASSSLHHTRTVKLALVQCACHTGK